MQLSFFFSGLPRNLYTVYLGGALLANGCATIAKGSTQRVQVISDPPGATITIDGPRKKTITGVTPCEIRIPRTSKPLPMRMEFPGRETYSGEVVPSTDGGVFALAALETALFLIPGMVDFGSGAAYDWPYEIQATLPASGGGQPQVKFIRQRPRSEEDDEDAEGSSRKSRYDTAGKLKRDAS